MSVTHHASPSSNPQSSPPRHTAKAALQADLHCLLHSSQHADIFFHLPSYPVPIPAHSSIIAVRCQALHDTILNFLDKHHSDSPPLDIALPRASESSVRKVFEYIYTATISLDAADVFDICTLATTLGIPSLHSIVLAYLSTEANLPLLTIVLDRALENLTHNRHLVNKLTEYFAEHGANALSRAPLHHLSLEFMKHIVKQENLAASELEIWNALIRWCCIQADIQPPKRVSDMTCEERRLITSRVRTFCLPGLVRILNFDSTSFAEQVEPLGVFPSDDVLLKYRFDAAAGNSSFEYAFPQDRYSFLLRIRQRTMHFESDCHPHPRGLSTTDKVELPQWVSEMRVTFDERTALGRYADLEFFLDEDLTESLFSFRTSKG